MSAMRNDPPPASGLGVDPIAAFLAERINGNAGHQGRSSDAMISAAVLNRCPARGDYPIDLSDFGRCCEAFDRAPWTLKKRMLPILRMYLEVMEEKYL